VDDPGSEHCGFCVFFIKVGGIRIPRNTGKSSDVLFSKCFRRGGTVAEMKFIQSVGFHHFVPPCSSLICPEKKAIMFFNITALHQKMAVDERSLSHQAAGR
jgi:hypothetical protein